MTASFIAAEVTFEISWSVGTLYLLIWEKLPFALGGKGLKGIGNVILENFGTDKQSQSLKRKKNSKKVHKSQKGAWMGKSGED